MDPGLRDPHLPAWGWAAHRNALLSTSNLWKPCLAFRPSANWGPPGRTELSFLSFPHGPFISRLLLVNWYYILR